MLAYCDTDRKIDRQTRKIQKDRRNGRQKTLVNSEVEKYIESEWVCKCELERVREKGRERERQKDREIRRRERQRQERMQSQRKIKDKRILNG